MTLNRNDVWKFGTLTVSPFDWLEASYFYYRPSDLRWEGNLVRGHYLDKGFNVKFVYRPKKNTFPNLAIGLDDFAGTGFFTREYLVASKDINRNRYTFGLGWGKFAGNETFNNPLSLISDKFSFRATRSENASLGGTPSYDQWFRGESAIFGGIEHRFSSLKGMSVKIEYDPFDYLDFSANNRNDAIYDLRKKDSNINIGLKYALNKFLTLDASYIKGNTINLSFNFAMAFNNSLTKKNKFKPTIIPNQNISKSKDTFYISLLNNLNNNNLYLQTAELKDEDNLNIAISTSNHRNAIRSSSYAAYISKKVADAEQVDLSLIKVSHVNAGVELNNITYIAKYLDESSNAPLELNVRNTYLNSGEALGYKDNEFKPTVNFPVIFSSISPTIVTHIGNPEKFYFGGINLQHVSEIQFSRNLLLSTEVNARLYDNFQSTLSGPGSNMEHVRTDLVDYLKEDDIYISRMQLDYIWSPYKDIYTKVSGGIYESMYGGVGIEALYKPFKKNFNVGVELFHVKQRAFNQRFSFQEYETVTGHLNFGYKLPLGIESNLSFGRYLAKDDGYTFDLSRTTKSGFRAGIYFTRTNVSAELFGEGSFDKGFYFQVPLDLLSKGYQGNYSTFKLSPLTRDGGAKLTFNNDLKGLIYNSTDYELSRQWSGFLN